MTHEQGKRKGKNRGNMLSFFDPELQKAVYGKREHNGPIVVESSDQEQRRSALVPLPGGRFEIDRKVLVEDCATDFHKAWFYEGATKCISHRIDR
jgi:hypothetical protein